MLLSEAIAGYIEHIRHERNLARTTCKHYASWLHGFTNWLAANGYPEELDLDTFQALNRAVMAVLAYAALRREEACSLLVDDVNLADKSLLVRSGKGSKLRRVFICSEGMTAIREWLSIREKSRARVVLGTDDSRRKRGDRDADAVRRRSCRDFVTVF